MGIRRVVPDITSADLAASRAFYTGLLGFEVAMDLGWVVTLASASNPTAQDHPRRPHRRFDPCRHLH